MYRKNSFRVFFSKRLIFHNRLVKDFDKMMIPLCSMMGMTQEEQKKIYEKRKLAKLDAPPAKKSSGFLGIFK